MSAERKTELRNRRRLRRAAIRPIEERGAIEESESDAGETTESDDDGSEESSTKCGSSTNDDTDSEQSEAEHVPPVEIEVPKEPTRAMILAHEITHIPYCTWCPICVQARGRNAPHKHGGRMAGHE